jgi:hypothetical protein
MAETILAIGGGFLLAVLWFDLMFDVQALGAPRAAPLPEASLASIAAYYRRVTGAADLRELRAPEARPGGRSWSMGRLVGGVMLATIAAACWDLFTGSRPLATRIASLGLLGAPIALAGARVLPNAVRLAARRDAIEEQSRIARAIARDHVACLAAILAFLAIRLAG